MKSFALLQVLVVAPAIFSQVPYTGVPEPPRVFMDTRYTAPVGNIIRVHPGQNLQTALDMALPGDTIVLDSGAEYVGSFQLSPKAGWVHVVTDGFSVRPGVRVTPADAPRMAKIRTRNSYPAFTTRSGASYWRLIGLDIANMPTNTVATMNLVCLQPPAFNTPADYPHHIILDRVYIHGNPGSLVRRGVRQGGLYQAIIDSYISDIRQPGYDTQAISDSQGPGPYKVVNNYLEASTENIGYGGSNPPFPGIIPCDIEIRHNHIYKPPEWESRIKTDGLLIKNSIEFKAGCRVLVLANVFENNYLGGQSGFMVVLTPQNSTALNLANADFCLFDVTFQDNVFKNSPAGINILGTGQIGGTGIYQTRCNATRIAFKNNLFELTGSFRVLQYLTNPTNMSFEQNTFYAPIGTSIVIAGLTANTNTIFRDNIGRWGTYGLWPANGMTYETTYGPPETVAERITGNVFVHPTVKAIPGQNVFVPTWDQALASGKGANMNFLTALTASVQAGRDTGQWCWFKGQCWFWQPEME